MAKDLSTRLKQTREALGETQEAFAIRIGVDQTTLSRWEAGQLPGKGTGLRYIKRVLEDFSRDTVRG